MAVITVGELPSYEHAKRRTQLFSNQQNSWYSKTQTGEANGFDVQEIQLDTNNTSTEYLLSQIYNVRDKVDGILVMWPLPDHIDSAKVYNAIDLSQDVDGAHYVGQLELTLGSKQKPRQDLLAPNAPEAVMLLLEEYGVDVSGKSVLVVGRSRICGSPLGHMIREKGGIVTVAHSKSNPEKTKEMMQSADVVVSCVGSPGIFDETWIKPGAVVLSLGTTFDSKEDRLVSDFAGDLSSVASQYTPVPGGIGPLSSATLFSNVAKAAWNRANNLADVESGWTKKPGSLHKTIHFDSYDKALAFANKVNDLSSKMDHHANMTFEHKCVNGVDLSLEFFSYEADEITEKDHIAALAINAIQVK